MSETNGRLAVGVAGVALFLVIGAVGHLIAPYPVDYQELRVTGPGGSIYFSPAPPTATHPFGTDEWGYDILTLMLHGLKYTLAASLSIAVLRTGIGAAAGIGLGLTMRSPLPPMQLGALGSVPVFILVYFVVFRVSLNPTLSRLTLVALQVSLIVVFGLPAVVASFQAHTVQIRRSEYVAAARSMGAGNGRIMTHHVFPQLVETFVSTLAAEMVAALTIVGQLAIFNVFVGGTLYTPDPPLFHSLTHEWAGLLGQARNMIRTQQWRLFFPLAGYLAVLVSFHLFAEGMEEVYRRRRRTVKYL